MYVNFRNETVQLSKVYLNFTDAFKISWIEKIFNSESMHPDEVAYRPVQQCLV